MSKKNSTNTKDTIREYIEYKDLITGRPMIYIGDNFLRDVVFVGEEKYKAAVFGGFLQYIMPEYLKACLNEISAYSQIILSRNRMINDSMNNLVEDIKNNAEINLEKIGLYKGCLKFIENNKNIFGLTSSNIKHFENKIDLFNTINTTTRLEHLSNIVTSYVDSDNNTDLEIGSHDTLIGVVPTYES